MNCSASLIGQPSRLHIFDLCLHGLAWMHIMSRAMHRTHRLINLIFNYLFFILFREVCGLVWTFHFFLHGGLVVLTGLPGFCYFCCFLSPCVWNNYSEVSGHSHNSTSYLRFYIEESNPWTNISFWHSCGSANSMRLRISSSGNPW